MNLYDAHRRTIATPSGDLSLIDVGAGPPVVLVHGAFVNALFWSPVVDLLAPRYRCIAIDLPAHGQTPTPPDRELSLPAFADAIAAMCDALHTGPVHLVGNDTGGAVAQVFTARHSDRVKTLTLTNCDAHDNFPPAEFAAGLELARAGELGNFVAAGLADLDIARSDAALGRAFQDADRLSDDEVRAFLAPLVETPERADAINRYFTSLDADQLVAAETALAHFHAPTLIVWGDDDPFFAVTWAHWLADLIPGARRVVTIPGGKLFFPFERAAELAYHLAAHWEGAPLRHDLEPMAAG